MKAFLALAAVIILVLVVVGGWQVYTVNKAHSSFENYYAFRSCDKLVSKTDTSAVCQLASGQDITLVQYKNKWYLQGDLPCQGPIGLSYFLCVI